MSLKDEEVYKLLRKYGITTISAAEVILDGYDCKSRAIKVLQTQRDRNRLPRQRPSAVVPGTQLSINKAIECLELCCREYYNGGTPPLSDIEYNALFNATRRVAPLHNFFADKIKNKIALEKKTTLQTKIGILEKLKIKQDKKTGAFDQSATFFELGQWLKKTSRGSSDELFFAYPEYDGVPCVLYYEDGSLVGAAIAKNGYHGEDITQQVNVINSIPKQLPIKFTCEIQGKIVLRKSRLAFLKKTDETVFSRATAKSLIEKTIRSTDTDRIKKREFDFCAWNLFIEGDRYAFDETEKFVLLKKLGFAEIGEFGLFSIKEIGRVQSYYWGLKVAQNLTLAEHDLQLVEDVDQKGIIVVINNKERQQELGIVDDHYKYRISLRFPLDIGETKIIDIIWQASKYRYIVPILKLLPVTIGGRIINEIRGYSYGEMAQVGVSIGARVIIGKTGSTMPKIFNVIGFTPVSRLNIPTECPFCKEPLQIEEGNLVCKNLSCSEQNIAKLTCFFRTIVKRKTGIGETVVRSLYNEGKIKNIVDFYYLQTSDLFNITGIGTLKAKSFLDAIEDSKYITLPTLLKALGLPRLEVGWETKVAKLIRDNGYKLLFPSILIYELAFNLLHKKQDKKINTISVDGLTKFSLWLLSPENQSTLYALQKVGIRTLLVKNILAKVNGIHVCITGQVSLPKNELSVLLIERGYKIHKSLKKNTDILVCNVENNTSAIQKAKKRGIRIITETEILAEAQDLLTRFHSPFLSSSHLPDTALWKRAISITKEAERQQKKQQGMGEIPNQEPLLVEHFETLEMFE